LLVFDNPSPYFGFDLSPFMLFWQCFFPQSAFPPLVVLGRFTAPPIFVPPLHNPRPLFPSFAGAAVPVFFFFVRETLPNYLFLSPGQFKVL